MAHEVDTWHLEAPGSLKRALKSSLPVFWPRKSVGRKTVGCPSYPTPFRAAPHAHHRCQPDDAPAVLYDISVRASLANVRHIRAEIAAPSLDYAHKKKRVLFLVFEDRVAPTRRRDPATMSNIAQLSVSTSAPTAPQLPGNGGGLQKLRSILTDAVSKTKQPRPQPNLYSYEQEGRGNSGQKQSVATLVAVLAAAFI